METKAFLNHPLELFRLARPQQWFKNSFVFFGLFFGHRWHEPILVLKVITAAFAFCFCSSAIYVFNDICDREKDRLHPRKSKRPLAAGTVTVPAAWLLAAALCILAVGLGLSVSMSVFALIAGYASLNVAYSIHLKDVVIVDVFCIAAGFMIRILVGTIGVGIPPSKWLLLCGLMVTLFLGFAKRRAEIIALADRSEDHRAVLKHYGPGLLDQISAICASGVIVTYCLYATSPDTAQIHHTPNLIVTAPFIIYAIFRYLYLVHQHQKGGDPSRELIQDKHIIGSVAGWTLTVLALLATAPQG